MVARALKLETHRHSFVSGPRANRSVGWPEGQGSNFEHSHEGGDTPHRHPDTGPASYTIDRDAWFSRTGLEGGGRKKYTKKPTGLQLERIELGDWQRTFRVIVGPSAQLMGPRSATPGDGPGLAGERMVQQFGMVPVFGEEVAP